MLAKCANPACSTELVYLREGKIFMMESSQSSLNLVREKPATPKLQNRVEHFWLCGPCSISMTLTLDDQRTVKVVRKPLRIFRAAAS